ncbi:MAG: hypothetical protein RL563_2690 [Pseudomonadota bacterium]|jgi:hypothetical protein
MKTSQFEAVKIALKQDAKNGFVLSFGIHPDELPDEIMRDFVGARYQVVMVRLNEDEKPMEREKELSHDYVRSAAILCRDQQFQKFLVEANQIFEASEEGAVEWLKEELGVKSRTEIPQHPTAVSRLLSIQQEFSLWKSV